jgi:DNA-binding IclR family transcriptional regulator
MGASVADGPEPVDRLAERAGVVDKVAAILDALEPGPALLSDLTVATGLPRATAHRLAVALARHGLVGRDDAGRFVLGLRLISLGHAAAGALPLRTLARPALESLRDQTGEGVQLYVAEDGGRRCVLSLQSPHGLRWIVPEGALLPLDRGSAGHVLSDTDRQGTRGWVESVEEREPGVASISAAVRGPDGAVMAAISVSGPVERLSRRPGARFGAAVVAAAAAIEAAIAS